ncbi:MAG: CHAT domain-containing protein [Anaerolineae bacterium]|nr:CHAT domain-containing protein [Anaerolineae bacterium]
MGDPLRPGAGAVHRPGRALSHPALPLAAPLPLGPAGGAAPARAGRAVQPGRSAAVEHGAGVAGHPGRAGRADGRWQVRAGAARHPSLAALQDRLLGDPVHILHFVGHGVFDEAAQAGCLVLGRCAGRPHLVRGEQLAAILRNHPAMRLAYLNACAGALASGQSVFTGVAQTLVREGRACGRGHAGRDQRRWRGRAGARLLRRIGRRPAGGRRPDPGARRAQRRRQPGVGHPRALQPLAGQPPVRHPPGAAHAGLPLPRHDALQRGAEGPVLWPGQGDRGRGGAPAPASLPHGGRPVGQRQVVADLRRRDPGPAPVEALRAGRVGHQDHAARRQPHGRRQGRAHASPGAASQPVAPVPIP